MRILISSYTWIVFDPPIINLAKLLVQRGHDVIALGIGRSQDPPLERVCDGFEIRRVIRGGAGAQCTQPLRYIAALRQEFKTVKPDWLVATNWHSLLAVSVAIPRLNHSHLVYYQLEYNDRTPHVLARQSLPARIALRIEQRIAKRAGHLFSAEPHRSRLMVTDYALLKEPPAILNTPLKSVTQEKECPPDESGPLRFVYTGAINPATGIRSLLIALARHTFNLRVHLYGHIRPSFNGEFESLLAEACRAGNTVVYKGVIPYSEMQTVLARYDVGIVLYHAHDLNTYYCSPCKLFEYFAAGLAVLTSDLPGLREVVSPPSLGLCANPTATDDVVASIRFLCDDPKATRKAGRRAREAFLDEYNFEHQSSPLVQVLERR